MRSAGYIFLLTIWFLVVVSLTAKGQSAPNKSDDLQRQYREARREAKGAMALADTLVRYADLLAYRPQSAQQGRALAIAAIRLADSINYPKAAVQARITLGNAHNIESRSDSALLYFLQAVPVAERNKLQFLLQVLYGNIAGVYLARTEYQQALTYYFKAADLLKATFRIQESESVAYSVCVTYYNMALALQGLYSYEEALNFARKSNEIAAFMGLQDLLPYTTTAKASILLHLNRLQEAEQLSSSLLAKSQAEDVNLSLQLLLGELRLKQTDTIGALSHFRQGAGLSSFALDRIQALCSLSRVHYYLHQPDSSKAVALEALKLAERYSARQAMMECYALLARINALRGDYQTAAHYFTRYQPLRDSLSNVDRNRLIYAMETQYRTAEKDVKLAQNRLLISEQRATLATRNLWIWVVSLSGLLIVGAFGFYQYHRSRLHNQRLRFLQQQEKARSLLAMTQGEEKERKRIASALHDGVVGSLTALKLQFQQARKNTPGLDQNCEYNDALNLLDQTVAEVRKTAHNLMPELLLLHGLPEAVSLFCKSIQKSQDVKISFQYYGFIDRLNRNFELFVYRIIQELVQNVLKHANASNLLLQLSFHDHILSLTVEDDGIGIGDSDNTKGAGLNSIRNRTGELGGTMNIITGAGKGTSIVIEFDLAAKPAFTYED